MGKKKKKEPKPKEPDVTTLDGEIWKSVDGYPAYKISSLGRVSGYLGLMTPQIDTKGYYRVRLDSSTKKIHRLVAQAFISNPKGLPQVNHKNTIKTDNSVDNLEWSTNLMNSQHAYKNGLRPYPGKLNDEDARLIRFLSKKGLPRKQLMNEFGVSIHVIKDIISKRSWTHV